MAIICCPCGPEENCHRKATPQMTIKATVTYGRMVVGLSSCSGIIGGWARAYHSESDFD